MRNIRGYFKGFDRLESSNTDGDLFCIYIGDSADTGYTEVKMAGYSPVVVNYNVSETPFDPYRTSTCTISIVADSYYEDVYPTGALDVPVVLKNETLNTIEWVGYLTPKVYDNNYTEEYETVQLEAADCLSVLQYVDYTPCSADTRGIRALDKILEHVADVVGIKDIYWMHEKLFSGSSENVIPSNIYLSEQNYYSSDTDEAWKMDEVLTEICRYLGFTLIQFQDFFAFVDPLQLKSQPKYYCKRLHKNGDTWSFGGPFYLPGNYKTLSEDDIRSDNASISFEPIYNKVTVKDNMYVAERLVPSIFEDNNLENRLSADSFYEEIELAPGGTPTYPYGCDYFSFGSWKKDGSGDSRYTYHMRLYDSKYWTSIYDYTTTDKEQYPRDEWDLTHMRGATIVDLGVVRNKYTSEHGQPMVPSKMDYTRYLMINQNNSGYTEYTQSGLSKPAYFISGYTNVCPYIADDTYIVIQGTIRFEKHSGLLYINPDWDSNTPKFKDSHGYKLQQGSIMVSVKMGNYYWNGDTTTWGEDFCANYIPIEWDDDVAGGTYNKDQKILNNVPWSLGVGEDGYIIPIKRSQYSERYPSMLDDIEITFHMPLLQTFYGDEHGVHRATLNGFCWIKDLDVKIVQKGQGLDRDSEADLIYENVINEDSIQEIRDITVKHTTAFSGISPSYSTVCYLSGTTVSPLVGIQDKNALEGRAPEENIIQKYVDEYSTPTKKITLTIDSQDTNSTPFSKYKNVDVENPTQIFIELGREIDYQAGTANITFIELK